MDTAAIPAMQQLDADSRLALIASIEQEMEEPLRVVTVDGAVQTPFHVNVAMATKAG